MSSFFGSSSSSSAPSISPADIQARKDQIKQQVQQELQLVNAQELINKMNEKCYAKCVPKPGAMLTKSEESCVTMCMDRYMEAFNTVSRQYIARLSKERGALSSAGGGIMSPEGSL